MLINAVAAPTAAPRIGPPANPNNIDSPAPIPAPANDLGKYFFQFLATSAAASFPSFPTANLSAKYLTDLVNSSSSEKKASLAALPAFFASSPTLPAYPFTALNAFFVFVINLLLDNIFICSVTASANAGLL